MPLIPSELVDRLAGVADGGAATVRTDLDPFALARAWDPGLAPVRVFGAPDGSVTVGIGEVWRLVARGPDRFVELLDALGAGTIPEEMRAFLGFSFAPGGPVSSRWEGFAAVEAVLPAVVARRDASGGTLGVVGGHDRLVRALATLEAPGPASVPDVGEFAVASIPSPTAWRAEVAEAVDAIRRGSIDKVVLARSVTVRPSRRPDPRDLLGRLVAAYPGCYGFSWTTGETTFLGASPELLVSVDGRRVRSNPLAGSAPRGEGEAEDRALGRTLLTSAKDRREHAFVVEDVAARLAPYVPELRVPAAPSLRRMATVQHLSTEIHGTLAGPTHVVELVGALHPTPAVGGTPREEAGRFIEKMERIDRGWYTGGIGWFDASGSGEVAIALRCGLLTPEEAVVYAGAGIVGDSDPDAELVETRLKFRPLLELLAVT